MTTPRAPETAKKPFQSTHARLLKLFKLGALDKDQLKAAFSSPDLFKTHEVKASVAIDAAKAGQIRAATKSADPTVTSLGKAANELMSQLQNPPETTARVTATMRESLMIIHDQHKTTAMGLQEDVKKIEAIRQRIFKAVDGISEKPMTREEIKKLETDTKKYFTELEALEKKIIPFLKKVEAQAANIMPSIQIPAEQKRLTS